MHLRSASLPALLAGVLFLAGCAGTGRRGTSPRKTVNPPAESSVGRNFAPEKFQKLAIVFPPATAQNTTAVADSKINPEKVARFIEDEFIAALLRKGYTVASRSDVQAALREINFSASSLGDKEASQLGKMLGVPGIMVVDGLVGHNHFVHRGRRYCRVSMRLSGRLVAVERAEVVWLGTKTFTGDLEDGSVGIEWLGGQFRDIAQLLPENR